MEKSPGSFLWVLKWVKSVQNYLGQSVLSQLLDINGVQEATPQQ
ncbi:MULTISPECIES: hypothetical protein [Enterococcus]|nr:hypothetical protein [Enterococcus hirae]